MSQFPHDRLNKNLLELSLTPFGQLATQSPLDPETTFLDIYFVPQRPIPPEPQLNLLARCIGGQAVAFEPYRNAVEVDAIQDCFVKALQIQQSQRSTSVAAAELQPRMWIITPTLSLQKLKMFRAVTSEDTWGAGIYHLAPGLQTGIIVVHQLPATPETLLFRLMGKGRVQQAAMAEVAALPVEDPYRQSILDLLVSYRISNSKFKLLYYFAIVEFLELGGRCWHEILSCEWGEGERAIKDYAEKLHHPVRLAPATPPREGNFSGET